MKGKRIDVDLGPMHLTVGDERCSESESASREAADPLAVARFDAAMSGGGGRHPQEEVDPESLSTPFALLGAPDPTRDTDEATALGLEIERLWISNGAIGIREVRLKIRQDLLPDTSVRLYEAAGRLRIDLAVGHEQTRRKLVAAMPTLAKQIGEGLKRPLRLEVSGAGGPSDGFDRFDWPEGA